MAEYFIDKTDREDKDDGFYMMNMEKTITRYRKWCELFPRIRPFYAMKCNPDPVLARQLHLLGVGFDCSSKREIELALSVGSKPSNIIYAHPCKKPSHISFAANYGVSKMTFDSKEELFKIKELYPEAEIVIRFLPTDVVSMWSAGDLKYGASVEDCSDILAVAKDLGLNVIGASFHIAYPFFDLEPYEKTIHSARCIFDEAEKLGFSFSLLDIGGGYTRYDYESDVMEKICQAINRSLEQHFPVSSEVEIIAEPGAYFACSPFTLVTNVIAVKEITKKQIQGEENPHVRFTDDGPDKGFMYFIDDGVFGSFLEKAFLPQLVIKPQVLKKKSDVNYPSCVWGHCLMVLDFVSQNCLLPKLSVGDWLYFEDCGAYRRALATSFNGFNAKKHVYYYISLETWKQMDWKEDDFGVIIFYENDKQPAN